MQKRAVAVGAAAVVLGLVAAVLGFAAESASQKAFVTSDVSRCEYRRTPALGWGILAALLSLAAVALVTAASGCFGRCGGGAAPAAGRRRGGCACACARTSCAAVAWLVVVAAAVMFLYGASRSAGGTEGFTAIRRRPRRNSDSTFDFVCDELRGVFVLASIAAVVAVACAVTAYVDTLQRRNDQTATPPTLGVVAMGQPDPAPPVAYPAQPPSGGYGAKPPAGTV